MKKRFGLDIDGTVTCPKSLLPFINQAFGMNIAYEDVNQYDLSPFVNVPEQEFAKWFTDTEPVIYKESPPAAGVLPILQQWKKQYELFFISARRPHLLDITKNWFTDHGVSFQHIELIGSHDKVETVKKHHLDLFFEDKHDNAVNIHEQCQIPVILFNTPYNQEPIPDGVIRVNNWREANTWVNKWIKQEKTEAELAYSR